MTRFKRLKTALAFGALSALLGMLLVSDGCSNPDAILLTVDADSPVDQFDVYVRHQESGTVIFHQGWSPVVDEKKQPIDLTKEKMKVAFRLSGTGTFTVQIIGVKGGLDADKPAVGSTQLFWARRLTATGVTRVEANLLTVPAGDDQDRDLWPDAIEWPAHVARAAELYQDRTLLDCNDKMPAPIPGTDPVQSVEPAEINPFAVEKCAFKIDMNCDGTIEKCVDEDGDGDVAGSDCDDKDPKRHRPTAADPFPDPPNCCGYSLGKMGAERNMSFLGSSICPTARCGDGIDNACKGGAVNDPLNDTKCIVDEDCDGFPAGPNDCDDKDPATHIGAPEPCGGTKDLNCDGVINACVNCDLDGDGYQRSDQANGCPSMGYTKPIDCNDYDAGVHPGQSMERAPYTMNFTTGGKEAGGDQYSLILTALRGNCRTVYASTAGGTQVPKISAVMGYVTGDADCNGVAYEGCPPASCDADGDGWPNADGATCNPNMVPLDCNDSDPTVFPGAPEKCGDQRDQDCSGADDACAGDGDGDGYVGAADCNDSNASIHPFAPELCDGLDNDCDGMVDEGNPDPTGAAMVVNGAVTSCTDSDVGECAKTKGLCVCSVADPKSTTNPAKRTFCPGEMGATGKHPACFGAGQPQPQSCDADSPKDDDCDGRNDAPDGMTPGGLAIAGTECGGSPVPAGSFSTQCRAGTVVGCDLSGTYENPFYKFGLVAYPGGRSSQRGYVCSDGSNGTTRTVFPTAEQCDYIDNNCDGKLGDGKAAPNGVNPTSTAPTPDEQDVDNDKYAACVPPNGVMVGSPGMGGGDCVDTGLQGGVLAADIHPGAPEKCNGVNDDCRPNWAQATDDGSGSVMEGGCGNTAASQCCSQGGFACRNLTMDKNNCATCGNKCDVVATGSKYPKSDSCGGGGMASACTCGATASCTGANTCIGANCTACMRDDACGANCTDCSATANTKYCRGGVTGGCVQCLNDTHCTSGQYCAANNTCQTKKTQGAACAVPTDCASGSTSCSPCGTGNCVDGFCCNEAVSACSGCRSCKGADTVGSAGGGVNGTCAAVKPGIDPHNSCTQSTTGCTLNDCGATTVSGTAGSGTCFAPSGTACGANFACSGQSDTCLSVCTKRADCSGTNDCCNGVCTTAASANGCNAHGTCVATAACTCDTGFTGARCEACKQGYFGTSCTLCPGSTVGATSVTVCSGNGTCADGIGGTGTCSCATGWAGVACDRCAPGFGGPTCAQCIPGTYSAGGTMMTKTPACTPCAAGSASPNAGATSAAACVACTAGTFAATQGSSSCTACPAGRISAMANATSCTACPAGQIAATTGLSSCTLCPVGTFQTQTAQSACTPCPLGTASNATGATMASTCVSCTAGTYAATTGQSACTVCLPGSFSTAVGATSASTCQTCAAGKYQANSGATSCDNCVAGTYSTTVGATSSATCTACAAMTFSTTVGASSAVSCQSCAAGTFSPAGATSCSNCSGITNCATVSCSSASNSRCVTCVAGYYDSDTSSNVVCSPCAEGSFTSAAGAPTSCTSCATGFANTGTANTSCGQCAPGYFDPPGTPALDCTACPVDSYTAGKNVATSCTACPAGATTLTTASTSCAICEPGFSYGGLDSSGNAICTACPSGQTSPGGGSGMAVCQTCPTGFTTSGNGNGSCNRCAAGYYDPPSTGALDCMPCPIGEITTTSNTAAACTPCSTLGSGLTTSSMGRSSCDACLGGFGYSLSGSTVTCTQCAAGTISAGGTTTCTACPNNTSSTAGSSTCSLCSAGYKVTGVSPLTCTACENDTFLLNPSTSLSCTACPTGFGNIGTGNTACGECDSGYYGASCLACPGGAATPCNNHGACSDGRTGGGTCSCSTGWTGLSCNVCAAGFGGATCQACGAGTFGPGNTTADCQSCTAVTNCAVTPTCTSLTNSQCTSCSAGFRLVDGPADTCVACTAVTGCTSTVTCTTSTNQQCTSCAAGRYLSNGPADTCPTCTPITNCDLTGGGVVTCTSATDQVCSKCKTGWQGDKCDVCAPGFGTPNCTACATGTFSEGGSTANCTACTDIPNCTATETCTSATDSQCSTCASGFFLTNGVADSCTACTDIPNCTSTETCTSASNSQCTSCASGSYLVDGVQDSCAACTAIDGCTSAVTCSSGTNQQCTTCAAGRYLVNGIADTCPTCTAIPNCTGTVTCTSSSNEQCSQCATGWQGDKCDVCAPGYGGSSCTACAQGEFSAGNSTAACSPCAPGTTNSGTGNSSCSLCAAGYYDPPAGGVDCTACPQGQFTSSSGNPSSCTSCPTGTTNIGTGNATCATCLAGFGYGGVNAMTGNAVCTACTGGQYSTGGTMACTNCTGNRTSTNGTSCDACQPAYTGFPDCTLLSNGQGCSMSNECASNLCASNLCAACMLDTDCTASQYCGAGGVCRAKLANNSSGCTGDNQCLSNLCTAGGSCVVCTEGSYAGGNGSNKCNIGYCSTSQVCTPFISIGGDCTGTECFDATCKPCSKSSGSSCPPGPNAKCPE